MKNPPEMVKTVMAAVCVMKGVPPDKIPDPNKPGQKVIIIIFFLQLYTIEKTIKIVFIRYLIIGVQVSEY